MKTKLIEFLDSSEWKTAQSMLRASKGSIFLGRLSFNLSFNIEYYLGALGLYHKCPCFGSSNFEATPLDAVRAFYWYDQHEKNVDIVEWIKTLLDDRAIRMLKEASR